MEKSVMRDCMSKFVATDTITVTFRESSVLRHLNGTFEVMSVAKGKGRYGSWIAELECRCAHRGTSRVTIATKHNNNVLNIQHAGQFYGYNSESEIPVSYAPNQEAAVELKALFRQFLDADFRSQHNLSILSNANFIESGEYAVTEARQLKGRVGQVILTVALEDRLVEIDSYHHSAVITASAQACEVHPDEAFVAYEQLAAQAQDAGLSETNEEAPADQAFVDFVDPRDIHEEARCGERVS